MRTLHLADLQPTRLFVAVAATTLLLLPAITAEAATGSDDCDDALVTFTRDVTTGDDTAVALTAQAVEQGVAGWEMVTWQAAPGTSLRAILVTLRDGQHVDVPAADTGTVEDVAAITFCGTRSGAEDGDGSDEAADVVPDDPQDPAEPETDDSATPETDDTATPETDEQPADTAPPSADDSTAPTTEAAKTTTEPSAAASPSADAEPTDDSSAPSTTSTTGSSTTTSGTSNTSSNTSSTSTNEGDADPSTEDDGASEDEEAEVLGVVIVAGPDTEDEDADQDGEPEGAATDSSAAASGSSADLAATDSQPDTTSSDAPKTEQLASSPLGDRGPLQQAWLLAAAIAVGVAAGASVIRYRATTASANADDNGENL